MIKKILIYIVIVFSIFLFVDSVNAQVSINGSNLTYNNFAVISEGNRILNFNQEKVYSDSSVFPKNFLITMCADNQQVSAWYVNNNSLTTVNVYTTNYSCTFPNSTYTGGHIVYVYGELNGSQACSVDGRNCIINGSLTMYVPNQSSWSILNEQYSLEPISIDYASGSIISNDQTIINQNNEIIQDLSEISGAVNGIGDKVQGTTDKVAETNEKLDDLNDNITDSDTSGAEDVAGGFFDDFDNEDYGLSDIITMPLQVINNITSATCSPLELPLPFVDTDVTLPCMYDIYDDYFGGFLTIYQTITFGIVAYWVCINIFRMVKNFKNPDNDEVEVLDL